MTSIGFAVALHLDKHVTATQFRCILKDWIDDAESTDTCLLYFFGHGGRAVFRDLPPPLDQHVFKFIECHKDETHGPFRGVLDIELSAEFARLNLACHSVTAIFDCCYSGELTRADSPELIGEVHHHAISPPHLAGLIASLERTNMLALESHPQIVRLTATSPERRAFSDLSRHLGYMTGALLEILEDPNSELEKTTWAFALGRIRERVIDQLRTEDQWVTVSGPRDRLMFSQRALPRPRVLYFVPGPLRRGLQPSEGQLRIGHLQGAEIGDRWAVAAIQRDAEDTPLVLAEGRIETIELSASTLCFAGRPSVWQLVGNPTYLVEAASPLEVRLDGEALSDPDLIELIDKSPWLRRVGPSHPTQHALLTAPGGQLELVDAGVSRSGVPFLTALCPHDACGRRRIRDQLEHWTKYLRLERGLSHRERWREPSAMPVRWWVERVGHGRVAGPEIDSLPCGERLEVEIESQQEPTDDKTWFVSAVHVDAAGTPILLNTRQPEGLEVGAGVRKCIGARVGSVARGFEISRPKSTSSGGIGRGLLLIIVGNRPTELGHLTVTDAAPVMAEIESWSPLAVDPATRTRGGVKPVQAWSCSRLIYTLSTSIEPGVPHA